MKGGELAGRGDEFEFCHEIDQIRMEAEKAEAVKSMGGSIDLEMVEARGQVSKQSIKITTKLRC